MNANRKTSRHAILSEVAKYITSAVIVLIGFGIAFWLYQLREANKKRPSDALIPLVEVAIVDKFQGEIDLEVSGTVVPFREISVAAEVGGVVTKKHEVCEAGHFVEKGTILLEIDPRDYELEVKTMRSEITQAERTLDETVEEIRGAVKNLDFAKRDFEIQEKEFRRIQRLKNSLSETEFDQARRALLSSENQLTVRQNTFDMLQAKQERLKSAIELINNRMEKAQLNLKRTVVVAPADGVIVRESVEQGDFVSVGRELLIFEDTSHSEVQCNLSPGELDWLRRHATPDSSDDTSAYDPYDVPRVAVQVYQRSDPRFSWDGVLERFDGIGLSETTKSIPCRIVVRNPISESGGQKRALVRGMYVKCRMVLSNSQGVRQMAAFPSAAVRPGDYVWVVRDEKLNRFDVHVIDRSPKRESLSSPQQIVIDTDVTEIEIGDQVVVSPIPQPVQGGRVLLKSEADESVDGSDSISDQAVSESGSQRSQSTGIRPAKTTQASGSDVKERGAP